MFTLANEIPSALPRPPVFLGGHVFPLDCFPNKIWFFADPKPCTFRNVTIFPFFARTYSFVVGLSPCFQQVFFRLTLFRILFVFVDRLKPSFRKPPPPSLPASIS